MPRKQRFKPSRKPKPPVDQAPPPTPIDASTAPTDGDARASEPDRGDSAPPKKPPVPGPPGASQEDASGA